MKRGMFFVVVVGAVAVLAACSSSSKSSSSTTRATSTTATAPSTSSSSTVPASSTPTTAVAATLTVVTNTKLGKQIIVTPSGTTVYLYMPDGSATTSKVPAALKAAWPAVTASGTSTVGAGLDTTKLALDAQPDGTKQVAYNGHLLYTFQGDSAPGSANGERLGGIWFVLSPAGSKIP